jgi:hypothetical protein
MTEFGMFVLLHPVINLLDAVSIIALQSFRESYMLFPLSTLMLVRLLQLAKAARPMEVTELGMVTLVSPLQPLNAFWPMVITEFGMVTLNNPVQPLNAPWPIVMTEFGMFVLLHPIINLLDAVSIIALQSFRES